MPSPVRRPHAEPRFRRCARKFFAHLFSNLGLFALVAGYVIVGAFVFRFLEAGNEREQRDRIGRLKNDCLGELWNITGELSSSWISSYRERFFCTRATYSFGRSVSAETSVFPMKLESGFLTVAYPGEADGDAALPPPENSRKV